MKKILFVIILILFSGCYNYRELNELAIVSAIGIDFKDNKYILTTQIINTKDKDKIDTIIYKDEGNNINEVLNNISKNISKNIFLSSVEIIIINKDIDINNIIDLFKNKEINKLSYVLISNNPYEILNFKTIEKINSKKIKETIKIYNKIVTVEDILKNYLNKKEISIPLIYIENNNLKIDSNIIKEIKNG